MDGPAKHQRHIRSGLPLADADHARSIPERVAAEAFVTWMRRHRVPEHRRALQCWTRYVSHLAACEPQHEIVRHYELAQPFWPLTINGAEPAQGGYGVDQLARCIRYRHDSDPIPTAGGGPTERVEFGIGCQGLVGRSSQARPVFVCEPLSPRDAIQVVKNYLIDAAISLAEGHGPLVLH